MNTKYLMASSSAVMAFFGLAASFLPNEILFAIGITPNALAALLVQITGALYFGFGLMNWMAKGVIIGGIYARALCVGNLAHFTLAGIALLKSAVNNGDFRIWILAIIYSIFAISFGALLYTNPKQKQSA